MWPQSKAFRIVSIAVFPLIVAIFAAIYTRDAYQYLNLLREDSLIEWLTFACFLLAGLLSWDIFIQIRQREHRYYWFFAAFGLFSILVALEEISWGQRILSLQSPDFFLGRSDQQEINVHNVLQQQLDFKTKDVAAIVLLGYGLILPLLALNSRIDNLLSRLRLVVPPLFLAPGFLIASLLMLDIPTGWEEELGEFLFSLCFLLFMVYELGRNSPQGRPQPFRLPALRVRLSRSAVDRLLLTALTLTAFALRFWQLGQKGLGLGGASRALAAQAPTSEIVRHIWQSPTIEPPAWPLLLHAWTFGAAAPEAHLRALPALASALCVPLLWQILKTIAPDDLALRTVAALFVALSPGMVYFAQAPSGHNFVVLLALLSLYTCIQLSRHPRSWWLPAFVIANWMLLSFYLYAVTFILAEALFLVVVAWKRPGENRRRWLPLGAGIVLSVLPFLMWTLLAPKFPDALRLLSTPVDGESATTFERLDKLWRDVLFGSVLWQPPLAGRAWLLFPFAVLGACALAWKAISRRHDVADTAPAGWAVLLLGTVLVPIVPAVLVFQGMPSGALLVIVPGLLILGSMGVLLLWRSVRLVGAAALITVLAVLVTGLTFYFDHYEKSAYRDMADYVASREYPDAALMIENNQQHPLTRYYLEDEGTIRPIPNVELSDYWLEPLSPVVPEEVDDQIQTYLHEHPSLWLILFGEKAVDPNGFTRQYLTAVSHDLGCTEWLDLELCLYSSPHFWKPEVHTDLGALFGDELLLEDVSVGLTSDRPDNWPALLLTLDWFAASQPSVDYTVSLRLLDDAGSVIAQRDGLPIGPLLPPTTWSAGDSKPGHMALPLPEDIAPGAYTLQAVLYDPADPAPLPADLEDGGMLQGRITLAQVDVADTIGLSDAGPSPEGAARQSKSDRRAW